MKRILFLFIGIIITNFTFALDKSGTISTETWSGSIVVTGTVTVGNGVVLTIDPGTTINFNNATSLIIQGTGIIHANGTSASKITFTNSTNASWQHIRFLATSSGSNLTNCIISNGNGADFQSFGVQGGGLYIGASGLTVDNCEISNCTAQLGAGIEIEYSSPVIKNSKIHDNTGEGIDLYNSNPEITNCVIYKNTSSNFGGGINIFGGDPHILNCIIAENTTTSGSRNPIPFGGIFISGATPHVINTIFWNNKKGSGTGYDYSGGAILSNCAAVQSISGQLVLSTINSDATGPNFKDPSTFDYSISYISPCRDAGVNTFSGVTIPNTDILGNSNIGTKDIGAYEVQYCRWNGGSTVWTLASNWDGNLLPGPTSQIIIPAGLTNYPNAGDITIGASGSLTIEAGATVQTTTFSNAGLLTLKSSETKTSSLFSYYYTLTGQTKVEMFLKGGVSPTGPRWHWITTPFTQNKSLFTTNPTSDNLLNYTEGHVATAINDGWNWHDGYGGTTGFSTLDPWTGYDVYYTADHTYTFSGTAFEVPGYYPTVVNLAYSGTDITLHGWNLVGNSYLCAQSWNLMGRTSGVHNAMYLSKENSVASYVNGVGTNGATDIIPPLQAFFVKVDATGESISFSRDAVSLDTRPRMKSLEVTDTMRFVRVNISVPGIIDESVIRLVRDGIDSFDNTYDATKFPSGAAVPQIYVKLLNTKYSIKSVNVPDSIKNVPVSVNVPAAGDYKINCTELTGMEHYNVTLTDNSNQQTTDLVKVKTYSFHADAAGAVDNRFVITISKIPKVVTYIDRPVLNEQQFKIYSSQGIINVVPMQDAWNGEKAEIQIINVSGKTVAEKINIGFSKGSPETFDLHLPDGIYFVRVSSSNKKFVGKIYIGK